MTDARPAAWSHATHTLWMSRWTPPALGQVLADADFLARFIVMGVLDDDVVRGMLGRRVRAIEPGRPAYSLAAEFGPVLLHSLSRWRDEHDRRCHAVRKAVAPHLMQGGKREAIQATADAAAHIEPAILSAATVEAIVLEELAWWLRQGYRARAEGGRGTRPPKASRRAA